VLDDDDAFATNLIARIRDELLAAPPPDTARRFSFLSFPLGYGLDVSSNDQSQFALYTHRSPYLNLGLTMVSRSAGKNLFSIRHRKTPTEMGGILAGGMPMFVRSLHGENDSQIAVNKRWKPLEGWRSDPEVADRFPFLTAF
jgi:Putative rhamnosyl transferase